MIFPITRGGIVLLLLSITTLAFADASRDVGILDKVHLIPPIYAKNGLRERIDIRDHYLYLSTLEETPFEVRIENADGSIIGRVSLSRHDPRLITLSASPYGGSGFAAGNIVTDHELNRVDAENGLVLQGEKAFYANLRHASVLQGASLTAKGQVAMGRRFRSGHLHSNPESLRYKAHFISVMAAQDNTRVSFGDISDGITFVGGNTAIDDVVLNQYESFTLAVRLDQFDNHLAPNALNGTLIESDKPIVVNSGSTLGGFPGPFKRGRDMGIDQTVPVDYLGTRFIPVKGLATTNSAFLETPIVVAEFDDTAIYLNGSPIPIAIIDSGEHYIISGVNYPSFGSMYIRTSQPAYVYQSSSGNNSTGPGMNYVSAIFDELDPQPLLIPDAAQLGEASISIVAPATAQVTVDGIDLHNSVEVPGTRDYRLYKVSGKQGNVEITSTQAYSCTMSNIQGDRGISSFFAGFPNTHAMADRVAVAANGSVTIDVLANDIKGLHQFSLAEHLTELPANGTAVVNDDDTITYTPGAGFEQDHFRYRIDNGHGITDEASVTLILDSDNDGVDNQQDADSDGDGISDSVEIANAASGGDTDGDQIPDQFDLDSDNDGVPDVVEAGNGALDSNNDGRVDGQSGDNGLADNLEGILESGQINYDPQDRDNDGVPDYLDEQVQNRQGLSHPASDQQTRLAPEAAAQGGSGGMGLWVLLLLLPGLARRRQA